MTDPSSRANGRGDPQKRVEPHAEAGRSDTSGAQNGAGSTGSGNTGSGGAFERIVNQYHDQKGALLPILHEVQAELGHIPDEAIDPIASALKLSKAEVYGVISFYHDYRREPAGRHVLKICRAEACQSMGAKALIKEVLEGFGLDDFGTSGDGKLTIEPVYCLGLCAAAPAALLDEKPLGRVSRDGLAAMIEKLAR